MFTKRDFKFKQVYTGNRLQNTKQYMWVIIAPNNQRLTDEMFDTKRDADRFLSAVLRAYREKKKTEQTNRPSESDDELVTL